jgi:hypothetical protein
MHKKLFAIVGGVAIAASVLALVPDDAAASSSVAGLGGAGGTAFRTAAFRGAGWGRRNAFAAADVAAASAATTWGGYSNFDCWTPGIGSRVAEHLLALTRQLAEVTQSTS